MKRWMQGLAVAVAACGPSTPPPQAPPSANVAQGRGASCESAIGHMIELLSADKPDAPADMKQKFHDLFVSHCQSDAWSPQVIDCFDQIKSVAEGDHCASMMTDAQRQSLDNAMGPAESAPGAAPASTPATPPAATTPPANTSRSGTPKKSGDPCDGGN